MEGLFSVDSFHELLLCAGLVALILLLIKITSSIINHVYLIFKKNDSTIKVDPYLHGVRFPVSYWTERGGRPYQEDRFHAMRGMSSSQPSLYGVFDGHGGERASQHCQQHLLQSISGDPNWEGNPSSTITQAFHKVNGDFSTQAREKAYNDGSTAVVGIIDGSKIYVANAGDSRAIVVQRGGKAKAMSLDHRPERKDEECRIRRLGGTLKYWGRWRVEGVLAVSRAIGDVSLQPFVTCDPEIIEKKIDQDDEYLVLASDGLWDVMDNEHVAKLVLNCPRTSFLHIAKELCTEAIILGSGDNITVMVVDIKQRSIVSEAH